ncbi:hypothetical protein ACFLTE_10640, partial [Bacteroidota bacterium]
MKLILFHIVFQSGEFINEGVNSNVFLILGSVALGAFLAYLFTILNEKRNRNKSLELTYKAFCFDLVPFQERLNKQIREINKIINLINDNNFTTKINYITHNQLEESRFIYGNYKKIEILEVLIKKYSKKSNIDKLKNGVFAVFSHLFFINNIIETLNRHIIKW